MKEDYRGDLPAQSRHTLTMKKSPSEPPYTFSLLYCNILHIMSCLLVFLREPREGQVSRGFSREMFGTRRLFYCLSRPLERDLAHLVKPCHQLSGSTSSTSLRVSLRPKQTRNENAKVQQLRTSRSPHDLRSVASLLKSSDYIETPRGTNRKKGRIVKRLLATMLSLFLCLSLSLTPTPQCRKRQTKS